MYNFFLLQIDSAKLVEIIRRELGTDTGNKNNLTYQSWILLGIGLILSIWGFRIYYYKIWKKYRLDLPNGRSHWAKKDNISYILSFTPNGKVRHHIVAGLCLASGLSIGLSFIFQHWIDLNSLSFHANFLSIAGILFAILTTSVTFWTLNQTKKLEHESGQKVSNFTGLIERISNEMKDLIENFDNYPTTQNFHRIYIITEHPFFGQLSFPHEEFTREYLGLLKNFKDIKTDAINQNIEKTFKFEIICGNNSCIKNFIEKVREVSPGEYNKKVESDLKRFEEDIKSFVDCGVAKRFQSLAGCLQFAVVGNFVFEFILEPGEPATTIIETHIVKDKKKADLFVQLFGLMKEGLSNSPSTADSTQPAVVSPPITT